jgi:UDP-2,3-diacylglucosamine pyrophosphatase LpxH
MTRSPAPSPNPLAQSMRTLLISDLHLGARNSRADLLLGLLHEDFDCLVLNGDVVDRPDDSRFRPADRRVVARLRELVSERELVVVRGNHDVLPGPANRRGRTDFLAGLLGTAVREEYTFEAGGRRYLVAHGDQFDGTLNLTWVGDAADWCYHGLQRASRPLAHWVKSASKKVCGVVEAVERGALAQARRRGFGGIVTGHTHFCHDEHIGATHYLNTGCWVDTPCSYVVADESGARLGHWEGRTVVLPQRPRWVGEGPLPGAAFNKVGTLRAADCT